MIFKRMLSFNRYVILSAYLILIGSGCKKDNATPSPIPSISFKSITPSTLTAFTGPVTISIDYTDGDGDLGENTTDVKNLFVTDNRIGVEYQYRVQQLAPSGSSIAITGTLNIVLDNLGLTDSSSQQTATFSVYLKDRAGHASNSVTTSAITIKKP